jgi:uncharacterized RDD family membrane protein YckC
VKCPKCDYLGFDTGDRCRNCGYDFSLSSAPALPLFKTRGEEDDEPLVKLPAAPRPPLSVRKTPDMPRMRAASRPAPRMEAEPILQFPDETAPVMDLPLRDVVPAAPAATKVVPRVSAPAAEGQPSGSAARLAAAFIDHVILFAIDAAVIYFTLRMADLQPAEWQVLPLAPLLAFLGLVKFAYFYAFTAVGGQTIGKMAVGIRVVTEANTTVDGGCAFRRTIAGVTAVTLGIGFIPALFGAERRAFHDRVARTRVVALRSA